MNKKFVWIILSALLSVTLFQCNNNSITKTVKLHPEDPYKNTIVPSQTFEINSKQDNIVEGDKGTIVVCPKGCFKNIKGEIVEDNVKIELSEALSLEDMLLSNLTTTSDGRQLETDGMIYFNATINGEQLTINKDNPIRIQIPTKERKAGMMAYKGVRDENGNMNWIEPKELDNYLVTVDINSLDFLPQGFQKEIDNGMPYKKYKIASQALTDSLYYNLSVSDGSELLKGLVSTNYNDQYYKNDNPFQPVKWVYSKEKIGKNEYDIIIKATIDKGWKLFSKEIETDYPIPLSIIFSPNKSYEIVGTLKNRECETSFEPAFQMNINYFTKEVEFRQRVKRLDKSAYIAISIEYMTCNDKVVTPRTENITITIPETETCGIDPAIIKVIKSEKYQHIYCNKRI